MKIRVGILENDQVYLSRLVRYFTSYYIEKLEISVFGDLALFLDYIQKARIDVFLANPDLVPEKLELPRTVMMGYLSESPQADSIDGVKVVFKYQKADLLYREILGLYAELDRRTAYKEAEGITPIYFFMGAAGGVGATTLAIACAASLAGYGKKVLYMNLEENGITSPFLKGDGNATMSDVLYAAKSNRSNLLLKLESMVRTSEEGIAYYEPFPISLDAHELTEQNLLDILNTLSVYEAYDSIIVDADAANLWKRDLLMKLAKQVFLVSDGTEICNGKLEKILHELTILDESQEDRLMSKVRVIYNRFLSGSSRQASTSYQELVYGVIDAFPKNNPKRVMEEIARRPFFDSLV